MQKSAHCWYTRPVTTVLSQGNSRITSGPRDIGTGCHELPTVVHRSCKLSPRGERENGGTWDSSSGSFRRGPDRRHHLRSRSPTLLQKLGRSVILWVFGVRPDRLPTLRDVSG